MHGLNNSFITHLHFPVPMSAITLAAQHISRPTVSKVEVFLNRRVGTANAIAARLIVAMVSRTSRAGQASNFACVTLKTKSVEACSCSCQHADTRLPKVSHSSISFHVSSRRSRVEAGMDPIITHGSYSYYSTIYTVQ